VKRADAIRGVVSVGAVALLLSHLLLPGRVRIDVIALVLLAVAILPWLGDVFESIDFPGGGGVRFRETVKAAGEVVVASAPAPEPAAASEPPRPAAAPTGEHEAARRPRHEPPKAPDAWRTALPPSGDANLQLVALRIEIEKRLAALAERNGAKPRSLPDMLRAVEDLGVLDAHVLDALRTLIRAGNMAAHGRPIDRELGDWVRDVGPDILRALDLRLESRGA
jgi:hypothetical protein